MVRQNLEYWTTQLSTPGVPLYTLDELADLVRRFLELFKATREEHLRTGHAQFYFAPHVLLRQLAHTYYVRIPSRQIIFDLDTGKSVSDSLLGLNPIGREITDEDVERAKKRRPGFSIVEDGEETIVDKDEVARFEKWKDQTPKEYEKLKNEAQSWLNPTFFVSDTTVGLRYDWPEGEYGRAPMIAGLSLEQSRELENLRTRMADAKCDILHHLCEALDSKAARYTVWRDCWSLIERAFSATELDLLDRCDSAYYHLGFPISRTMKPHEHHISGGLSDILYFVAFCEKEIKIGTYSRAADALGDADLIDRQSECHTLLGSATSRSVQNVIGLLQKSLAKEEDFWEEDGHRRTQALETAVSKATQADVVKPGSAKAAGFDSEVRDFIADQKHEVTWGRIRVKFLDEETLSIAIQGTTFRKNFAEMGFKNRRTGSPNKAWETLQMFAIKREVSFYDIYNHPRIESGFRDQIAPGDVQISSVGGHTGWLNFKRQVSELRKRLRAYFGIEEDPVPYVTPTGGFSKDTVRFKHLEPADRPESAAYHLLLGVVR